MNKKTKQDIRTELLNGLSIYYDSLREYEHLSSTSLHIASLTQDQRKFVRDCIEAIDELELDPNMSVRNYSFLVLDQLKHVKSKQKNIIPATFREVDAILESAIPQEILLEYKQALTWQSDV